MKKLLIICLFITAVPALSNAQTVVLDSLKQKLQLTTLDSLKSPIYSDIAAQYMKYDTVASRRKRANWQSEALNYTMLALHNYSFYSDTTGLRVCFDNLARVYHSQKKYSQAKWFILQSNNLSRIKKDVPNIITSLIKLSTIKMDIKDYKLAMRDLNEALTLSTKNNLPQMEATVQKNYGFLYNRMKDFEKGDIALKRADAILDSIKKDQETKMLAMQAAQDTTVKRDTGLMKKKAVAVNRKVLKKATPKKVIASL